MLPWLTAFIERTICWIAIFATSEFYDWYLNGFFSRLSKFFKVSIKMGSTTKQACLSRIIKIKSFKFLLLRILHSYKRLYYYLHIPKCIILQYNWKIAIIWIFKLNEWMVWSIVISAHLIPFENWSANCHWVQNSAQYFFRNA